MFAQLSNPSAEDAVSNKGKPETRLRLDDEKLWGYSQTQLHRVIYLSVASSCQADVSTVYDHPRPAQSESEIDMPELNQYRRQGCSLAAV